MQKTQKRTAVLAAALGVLCLAAAGLGLCAKIGFLIEKQPAWVSATAFCAAAVALIALLFLCAARTERAREGEPPLILRLMFSDLLLKRPNAARIAYVGVTAALCIVSNMFEIKFATTQFSLTLYTSCLAGILLGAVPGFCAVLLGDALGYVVNSMGYVYYWWVALACAAMALISGLVMRIPFRGKGSIYLKLALISVLTFLVCSVGINTTGMYYIGLGIYFPQNVLDAVAQTFGGRFDYWVYFVIRFFLLGQIWNSLVNYALLFLTVPALRAVRNFGVR